MSIVIWLFTFLLVLDCLILMLLVLIQLPKKEAGAGIAFGGGATDALFGAGSGTALTKMTKYCSGLFLGLSLLLSILNTQRGKGSGGALEEGLRKKAAAAQPVAPAATNTLTASTSTVPILSLSSNTATVTNPATPPQK